MDKITCVKFSLSQNEKNTKRDIIKSQNFPNKYSCKNMFASELQKAQANIIRQEEQSKQNIFGTAI